jgi:hypothetical protein
VYDLTLQGWMDQVLAPNQWAANTGLSLALIGVADG